MAFIPAGIFQQPVVAGVAAKGFLPEGLGRTARLALAAGAVIFEEAALPVGSRCGIDDRIGDHAAQPPAAPLVRDEHVVVPEIAETGYIGHMFVGPVAHKLLFIEIVGGGQARAAEAFTRQESVDPVVDVGDQPVGLDVGHGPCFGSKIAAVVGPGDGRIEGQKIGDHRAGAG